MEISREAQEKLAQALGATATGEPEKAAELAEDASTLTRIARIIEDVTGVDAELVTAESDLTGDLGISSLSLIEISVKTEDALRVRLSDEEIWSAHTVADLVDLAEKRAEPDEA